MIDKVIKMIDEVLEGETILPPNDFCKVMSSGKAVLLNMKKLVKDTYKPPLLEGHGFTEGYYTNPVRTDALPRPVWSTNESGRTVYRDNLDEASRFPWSTPEYYNARGIVSDNGVPLAEEQGRNKEKGMIAEPEPVNHSKFLSDTGFHDRFHPEEQGRDKGKSMNPEPDAVTYSSLQSETGFRNQFYPEEQGGNKEMVVIPEVEAVDYDKSQCDMECYDQFESSHSQMEWGSSILNGSLLEADPFDLLIVLLSVSIGLNLQFAWMFQHFQ